MINYTLNIGDVVTSSREANFTCFGLGSCIGLFLQDRLTGFSGGAHILLPESEVSPKHFAKYYNVDAAFQELIRQFQQAGSSLQTLRAKIVGGANVINANTLMGFKNAESVTKYLIHHKIFIAGAEVGGVYSRTANYNSQTGILTVRIPQINQTKII